MLQSKPRPKPNTWGWSFAAIGTQWQINIFDDAPVPEQTRIKNTIASRIEAFDQTYSRFRADSLVTTMAQSAGQYELPPDATLLMGLYRRLYEATGGKVTPLIGQTLVQAGYDADYSLTPRQLTPPPIWDEALDWTSPILTVKQPAWLDFGAAGKGYLVDLVANLLATSGHPNYCINAGGDIRYHGAEPLRVGLEHPDDPTRAIGVASIASGSLCGSAGNRRQWAGLTHIMDPDDPSLPDRYSAVWVMAETAVVADALTTALYFCEPIDLQMFGAMEYLLMAPDGTVTVSDNFTAEMFV